MIDGNDKHKEPIVRLVTAPNDMVAGMWTDVLEQNGIRSMTKRADFSAAFNIGYSFSLQCEIYVLASDEVKAKEVLAPFLEND